MCEIFGLTAKEPVEINEWLKELYSHSAWFPNGWGLAIIEGSEINIEKEPVQALASTYLKHRLEQSIETRCSLAHIRHALPESMKYCNCHPFTKKDLSGRRWTLTHNGAIFSFEPLDAYAEIQIGSTDTERILLYLVDQIDQEIEKKGHALSADERFDIMNRFCCSSAEGNRMNFLIYDGEYMYVHTNKIGDLFYRQTEEFAVVSTKPLDDGGWKPVPFTRLVVFKDGELVHTGTNHGQEFIETEEHLRILGF